MLRVFYSLNIAVITTRTFFRHQSAFLNPTVHKFWEKHQKEVFAKFGSTPINAAGDGRSDSPGHCAKFGTYTILEETTNQIIDIQTVQVSFNHLHTV